MLPELVSRRSNCNLRLGRLAEIGCKCQVESRALEHRLFCFFLTSSACSALQGSSATLLWVPARRTYIYMDVLVCDYTHIGLQNLMEFFEKPVLDLAVFNHSCLHWQVVSQEYLQILHCFWACLLTSDSFVLRIKSNSLFREWKLFWVSLLTDAPEFYYFCHPTHSPNLITNSFLIHVSYLLVLYILTGWKGFYWDPLTAVWLLGHGTVLHCREFWVFVVHLLL